MGADGGIGSTYNIMPDKFIKIKALVEEGKLAEAKAIQGEANKVITALCKVGVMQGEKAVLTLQGLDFGDARPPYKKLTKEDMAFLEKTVLPLL